mgnify:CR=1 FL=1
MDENQGVAGFYSDNSLIISGAFRPIFNDIEVIAANDLVLEVGVGVTNNANFILGDVETPRTLSKINLEFISGSYYNGEAQMTKVNGYAAITNKQNFIFPIGDLDKLRPLELSSESINTTAKSAYFFENPNYPTSFLFAFNTDIKTDILSAISTFEFWALDSELHSKVKLSWDPDSNLDAFVDKIENLRIVGWHSQNAIWENLGGNSVVGDLESGEITSDTFIPDDYTAISFGSSLNVANLSLDNYLLTPNGDGTNDFLSFDAICFSPKNNSLNIYNRWGRSVYSVDGYQNNFVGISDNSFTVSPNTKLPDGVYFYILKLDDINLSHQGYFAIKN